MGSSPNCCLWSRVFCNPQTGHVEMLDLHGDLESGQPLRGEISPSLMDLPNLNYLDLSYNDFNGSEIPKFFGSLTKLRYLDLSWFSFGGKIPIELGKLLDLRVLNLSHNGLVGSIPFHLANLSSLQELCLDWNHLVGNIPSQFGNLSSLQILSVAYNDDLKIDYKSPVGIEWLSNLQSLTSLVLSDVNLNYSKNLLPIIGRLPNLRELYLDNCSLTDINILSTPASHLNFTPSLVSLGLGQNKLTSVFPWLLNISSNLASLSLDNNHLGGPILDDFGKSMNSLMDLDLSDNDLNGTISDVHFSNLTKLQALTLSCDLLTLKFSNNWIPPFQLQSLLLSRLIRVFHAEINDSIPEWFWRLVEGANVLQIESSNLTGTIPNLPLEFTVSEISLASNQIEGYVPSFLLKGGALDISRNQFSEFVLSCGKGINAIVENLVTLDLSYNNLQGKLPDCWDHFKSLRFLDLSNNQLSGEIPNSIGSLSQLEQLILWNNCFSGVLPSLKNATALGMLDLGKNDLSGPIPPSWTKDNLKELQTLSLRMNKLDGKLPIHLCYLKKVRVLDLSLNKFTGPIPSCIDKLVAMAQKHVRNDSIGLIGFYYKGESPVAGTFGWNLPMVWKGRDLVYHDRYGLLSIDLSHSLLEGEMPTGIGKLVELRFLNLSSNKLSGKIIQEIGELKSLEVLDLSENHFHGEIPSSLAEISSLSILNLSNNSLSGEIPTGTQLQSFDPSSYEGNPYLCGRPLDKLCPSEDHPLGNETQANQVADEDDPFMRGFYESLGVGFAVGFWIVFGSLLAIPSWRHAYFNFLSKMSDSIYVATVLRVGRWRRWLRN
ncbi:receptor-like protein EIX1 [Neltuma alba]|uniref:receptor-like protein EIX1 n=1 Tax=Neltuma alba TaxID=207710 RepID=UPI0010A4BEFA|nr:receptor-like protein EIX1 [Prosopis alba]